MAQENLLWMKDFLQDDLYLLDADKQAPVPADTMIKEETIEPAFNYIGRADSGFLILVNYAGEEHISEAHLQSLGNILGRKNIGTGDVTILNRARQADKTHQAIQNYFNPERLLIMGADALPEDFTVPELNSIVKGQPDVLYTFSFAEMDSDDKKRTFWNQMKNF